MPWIFWTSSLETQTLLSLLRLDAKGPGALPIHNIIIEAKVKLTGAQMPISTPLESIC
jgi:hypothetical protein